jgi:hypothetical protein
VNKNKTLMTYSELDKLYRNGAVGQAVSPNAVRMTGNMLTFVDYDSSRVYMVDAGGFIPPANATEILPAQGGRQVSRIAGLVSERGVVVASEAKQPRQDGACAGLLHPAVSQ